MICELRVVVVAALVVACTPATTTSPSQPTSALFTDVENHEYGSLDDLHEWLEDIDHLRGERASASALAQEGMHRLVVAEREVAAITGEGEPCPERLGAPLLEFVGVASFVLTIDARAGMMAATLRDDEPRCWPLLAAAPHDARATRVELPGPGVSANLELRGDHEGVEQVDVSATGVGISRSDGEALLVWQPPPCFADDPMRVLIDTGTNAPLEPCQDDTPTLALASDPQGLLLVLRFECVDGRRETHHHWWPWQGQAYDSYCEVATSAEFDMTNDPDIRSSEREHLHASRERWPLGSFVLVKERFEYELELESAVFDDDGEEIAAATYRTEILERWLIPSGDEMLMRVVTHETSDD